MVQKPGTIIAKAAMGASDRDARIRDSFARAPPGAGIFGQRAPIFADRRISPTTASSRGETLMAIHRNIGCRREFRISPSSVVTATDDRRGE